MIYWKCNNCSVDNLYPDVLECNNCGKQITLDQIEEAKRFDFYCIREKEGDTYAIIDKAKFHCKDNGFKNDSGAALSLMKEAADKGNAEAQLELAKWYISDNEFPLDKKAGFSYALKSFKSGNKDSAVLLSTCCMNGIGTEVNTTMGIEMLKISSDLGYSKATEDLGFYYYTGRYVEKDERMAAKYYLRLRLEDNCHNTTAYNIGFIYWRGSGGTPVNYKESIKWFEYCVKKFNDLGAKVWLANFKYNGYGYRQNKSEAIKEMQAIANNNKNKAASNMAKGFLSSWRNQ